MTGCTDDPLTSLFERVLGYAHSTEIYFKCIQPANGLAGE